MTAADVLAAICRDPDDLGLRMAYSDWLEERGEPLGEFIRVQCRIADLQNTCGCGSCVRKRGGGQHHNGPCAVDQERIELPDRTSRQAFLLRRERELLLSRPDGITQAWLAWSPFFQSNQTSLRCLNLAPTDAREEVGFTYRHGFVEHVTLPLAQWIGEECEMCDGSGSLGGKAPPGNCWRCHGTGRLNALGPKLVAAAPIREVEFVGFEPLLLEYHHPVEEWDEVYCIQWRGQPPDGMRCLIPRFLMLVLYPMLPREHKSHSATHEQTNCWFPTAAAARQALSDAALTWARQIAFPDLYAKEVS